MANRIGSRNESVSGTCGLCAQYLQIMLFYGLILSLFHMTRKERMICLSLFLSSRLLYIQLSSIQNPPCSLFILSYFPVNTAWIYLPKKNKCWSVPFFFSHLADPILCLISHHMYAAPLSLLNFLITTYKNYFPFFCRQNISIDSQSTNECRFEIKTLFLWIEAASCCCWKELRRSK